MGKLKMEKKAQRFIYLLARKLSNNVNEKEQSPASADRQEGIEEVKQTFKEALDNLPKGALRTELQRNAATYARNLEKLINEIGHEKRKVSGKNTEEHHQEEQAGPHEAVTNKLSKSSKMKKAVHLKQRASPTKETKQSTKEQSHRLDGKGPQDKVQDSDDARKPEEKISEPDKRPFVYNMYADDAKTTVVDSLRKLSSEEKLKLAPHAYTALRSPSSFSEFLRSLHPNEDVLQDHVSSSIGLLKQEILAGFGVENSKVFIRCLADCLSVIIAEADACFAPENTERLKELQEFILGILLWAKIHHGNQQQENMEAASLAAFDDLVAAILSIFVDVSIVLSRVVQGSQEAEGRKTLSRILQFIGHSSSLQLNMLLQVTQAAAQDGGFMLPICRHVINKKPNLLTNELFIKYVYAAAFSRDVLQDHQEAMQDITHIVSTIEMPPKFFLWLYDVAPEAYSSLPDTVKCNKLSLAKYLMEEAPRDYLEKLLDILSDQENASQDLSSDEGQGGASRPSIKSPVKEADATSSQSLFFTDTSGDKDLSQLVDTKGDSAGASNRLDASVDEIDGYVHSLGTKKSSEEEDNDNFSEADNPEIIEEAIPSSPDDEPQTSQDRGHDDSDSNMDTGLSSDIDIQEMLSFEEERNNLLKAQATEKAMSPASRIKEFDEDVQVIPETQLCGCETDAKEENSTKAKDESDSWIVVDEDISFITKASSQETKKRNKISAKDRGRKNVKQAFRDESDNVIVLEKDGAKDLKADPPVKTSPKRSGTKSQKKSSAALKMQESLSEEMSQTGYGMHLRSMDHNQSSLLKFFTPVRRTNKESIKSQKPREETSQEKKQANNDEVQVIPNSCSSADESDKTEGLRSASPQRKQTLKSLSVLSTGQKNLKARTMSLGPADAKQLTNTPVNTSVTRKQKRLSRSARLARIPWEPEGTSSDSNAYIEASSFIKNTPSVLNSSKGRLQLTRTSEHRTSAIKMAVSEGIRQIRQECEGTPAKLPQESSPKPAFAKRKSLTITGGVKNKAAGTATRASLVTRLREHSAPTANSSIKQEPSLPKRPRLKHKDLGETLEDTLEGSQRRFTKKQTAVIQPVSDSSQRSAKLEKSDNPSVNKSEGSSPSRKSRTASKLSQASPVQATKWRDVNTRCSPRTSPKRRASQSATPAKSAKKRRKSTGLKS